MHHYKERWKALCIWMSSHSTRFIYGLLERKSPNHSRKERSYVHSKRNGIDWECNLFSTRSTCIQYIYIHIDSEKSMLNGIEGIFISHCCFRYVSRACRLSVSRIYLGKNIPTDVGKEKFVCWLVVTALSVLPRKRESLVLNFHLGWNREIWTQRFICKWLRYYEEYICSLQP